MQVYVDNEITVVPNVFFDLYMPKANEAQIKVYLYLLRKLSSGESPDDIDEIAEELDFPASDIMRSLRYWQDKGVLELSFDDEDIINGICLKQLTFPNRKPESSPKREEKVSVTKKQVEEKVKLKDTTNIEVPEELQARTLPMKRAYGADDFNRFKRENGELISIAENYLMKMLARSDIESLIYIRYDLGFEPDVIDILLQYCCGERRGRNFHYIETVADGWYESGISSVEEARAQYRIEDTQIRHVFKVLGREGNITTVERRYATKWFGEYGFTLDTIQKACEIAVERRETDRLRYANGILSDWYKRGLKTIQDVNDYEKQYKEEQEKKWAEKSTEAATKIKKTYNKKKVTAVDNYAQGNIDPDELDRRAMEEDD